MNVGCRPSAVGACSRDGHTGSGHHDAGHGVRAMGHGIEDVGIGIQDGIQDGYRRAHDMFAPRRVKALPCEEC